jgi:hypothetical protein
MRTGPSADAHTSSPVTFIAAGIETFYAVTQASELFVAGVTFATFRRGRLAYGNALFTPSFQRVEQLAGVHIVNVTVGAEHALASAQDGRVAGSI